jgi:hypothetical protein
MKNKILLAILILGLLSIYPLWRYYNHAKIFAEAVLNHADGLGKWSHTSIQSNLDGKITIRNLNFTPQGYTQSLSINNVVISTNPGFLFKSNAMELNYVLPETLSISINSANLNRGSSDDFSNHLKDNSYWMLMAGYAGSFGCQRESYTSFDDETWSNLFDNNQLYNVDLFYSRQGNGSLDVDLILDAENLFSTTWSSNLKSSYNDKQIVIDEMVVDKLFYNYLDNGFNKKRNDACKENFNSSYAAYRISSAEHVQKYIRNYFTKELPTALINLYQRMLEPDTEYSATFTFIKRQYLKELYKTGQRKFYENAEIEIASRNNNYIPVELTDIDFTVIDSELLKEESIKRENLETKKKLENLKQKVDKNKPIIYKTATQSSRKVDVSSIQTVINKKVRIKTYMGRPITGYIRSVDGNIAIIESRYKSGFAKLSIARRNIASIELLR